MNRQPYSMGKSSNNTSSPERVKCIPGPSTGEGPKLIQLTEELIDRCRTDRGTFTEEAARFLGAELPLTSGWVRRLVGRWIPEQDFRDAIARRNPEHPKFQSWFARSPGQRSFGF